MIISQCLCFGLDEAFSGEGAVSSGYALRNGHFVRNKNDQFGPIVCQLSVSLYRLHTRPLHLTQ